MSSEGPAPESTARRAALGADRSAGLRWGLLGIFAGALLGQSAWGVLSGAAIGAIFGIVRAATRRGAAFEAAFAGLEARIRSLERGAAPAADAPRSAVPVAPLPVPAPSIASAPPPAPAAPARVEIAPAAHRAPRPPERPAYVDEVLAAIRAFFLGGNTVVRVGILVLLIGVVLLAKWAVDHALFPIEARLAAAASIGLALAGVGYRLRDTRPGFATTLQGGGVAALYLVVFFAYRIFERVPAPLAFALFIAISIACGTLAIVQRSQPLIFIGSVGGFAAPILASTGEGNHVVLFSYYLLLNLGIAAAAWREKWRALNLLAFFCTYAVATLWGVLRYRPEQFASTEPFLLAYLVLFTGVALVHAWRQPPRLAGIIDGTLVFGTPLVTLLAQARLVEGLPLGMAISTAGFGLFYAALATWVWRRAPEALRQMAEAFVALAVVFGTIAIPLGLDDGLTTTLAWSLEGAGLYWVGTRQQRRLPRFAGVALQGLAAVAYGWAADVAGFATRSQEFIALANPRFLSGVGIAAAGMFIAREAYAQRERLPAAEWQLVQALAGWGLLWWAGACAAEIDQFAPAYLVAVGVVVIATTSLALERAAAALAWLPGRLLAVAVIPAGFLMIPPALERQPHLLADGGWLAWPLLLLAVYAVLRRLEGSGIGWTRTAYAPALWLAALVAGFGLMGTAAVPAGLRGDWPIAGFAVGLASVLLGAQHALERGLGPFGRFRSVHLGLAAAPLAALAVWEILALNLRARGDAAPLPYLPLLGPADAAIALLFLAVLDWWIRLRRATPEVLPGEWRSGVGPGLIALAFVWGNGVLVRSVYQWTDVPFRADALWDSTPLQVALSISWTLVALAGMLWCTKRGWRTRWIAAATLLGVTVTKLFVVDLSTLSTGAKIGTFLVVGVLLLVVGYLSPVPPGAAAADTGEANDGAHSPERGDTR